jgi:hypothetical protein
VRAVTFPGNVSPEHLHDLALMAAQQHQR